MDLFSNKLSQEEFRRTNKYWNELALNTPWSVGRVTYLIQLKDFASKEEWENFYYESGIERLNKIKGLDKEIQDKLFKLKRNNRLDNNYRELNTQYGRTSDALKYKAKILHDYMISVGEEISLEVCEEAVRFRVICETWNGVVIRERATIDYLTKWLSQKTSLPFEFRKADSKIDYQYEVDFELFIEGKKYLGIQIKPPSYRGMGSYLADAKRINYFKNQRYTNLFGVPVLYIYSTQKGVPQNLDEITTIIEKILKEL